MLVKRESFVKIGNRKTGMFESHLVKPVYTKYVWKTDIKPNMMIVKTTFFTTSWMANEIVKILTLMLHTHTHKYTCDISKYVELFYHIQV